MPETLIRDGRVTIVAELSCSHGGKFQNAIRLIDAAKKTGADAVKFQLFTPDEMVGEGREGRLLTKGPWKGKTLRQLYTETMTPREWFPDLFAYAREQGLVPFSSVLSLEGVDYLETLDCPAYKIPSAEIAWGGLIEHALDTDKPVIASLGMVTVEEWQELSPAVIPMCCVAAYPASVAKLYEFMDYDAREWGLSDHSQSLIPPIIAAYEEATLIEKHIRLEDVETADSGFALTPAEFADMTFHVKQTEAAMREPTEDIGAESLAWKRVQLPDGRWVRGG